MFIYMLFNCHRKNQIEDLYKEFNSRFGSSVRECRRQESGARYLELVFRADDHRPFVAFAQEVAKKWEGAKPPFEFAYDDGVSHMLSVDSDGVSEDEDHDHSTENTYLPVFTGIRDNTSRAIKEWAKEVEASDEEIAAKQQRIAAGERAWNDRMERDLRRWEKKQNAGRQGPAQPAVSGSVGPTTIKYSLPPNLSKARVLEFIQKLNASGEVIIPVFMLKDEIDKKMTKDQMLQLYLDLDRSRYKSELFELLQRAVEELKST